MSGSGLSGTKRFRASVLRGRRALGFWGINCRDGWLGVQGLKLKNRTKEVDSGMWTM